MITWSFFGEDGMRALTRDETGSNLPQEFAPWHKFKIIQLPGSDDEELSMRQAIIDYGYFLFEKNPDA